MADDVRRPPTLAPGFDVPFTWALGRGADVEHALREALRRTNRPVTLTETSYAGGVRSRRRSLRDSVAAANRIRDDGLPLIGYTWFPAFSLVAWSYLTGSKPTEAYMAHMGLWDLHDDGMARSAATRRGSTRNTRRSSPLNARLA